MGAQALGSAVGIPLERPKQPSQHQTGWTGVVAKLIDLFGRLDGKKLLDAGKEGGFAKEERQQTVAAD